MSRLIAPKYDKHLLFRESFMSPKSVADNGGVATGFSDFNNKAVMNATGKYVEYAKLAKILGAVTGGNKKLSLKTVVDTPTDFADARTILSFRSAAGCVVEIGFWTTGKMYAYSTASSSVYSTSAIGAGKHTLEWAFDGTNVYFYTDGVENGSAAFAFTAWTNQTTRIGAYTLGTSQALLSILYSLDAYNATHTAEEAKDLCDRDTFSELEKPSIYLPLRSRYSGGANMVTKNLGTLGGTALVGDGVTAATFPAQLSPHGAGFDGGDYLITNDTYTDITKPFTLGCLMYLGATAPANSEIISSFNGTNGIIFRVTPSYTLQIYLFKTVTDYIGRISSALAAGKIVSVIATYDGSGTAAGLATYANGTRVDTGNSNSGTFGAFVSTTPFNVGCRPGGTVWMPAGSKIWMPFKYNFAATPMQARALHRRMVSSLNV